MTIEILSRVRLPIAPVLPDELARKADIITGESVNYKIEPQDTGVRWIDGQAVWRRVFITASGASGAANSVIDIPAGWGFHGLVRLDGYLTTATGIRCPLQYYGSSSDYLGCQITEDGVITERHGGAHMDLRPMIFVIDYISFPTGTSSWDGGTAAWDNGTTTWDQ